MRSRGSGRFVRRLIVVLVLAGQLAGLLPLPAVVGPVLALSGSSELTLTQADLTYILKQIQIAEAHAAREVLAGGVPIVGQVQPASSVLGLGPNDVSDPAFPWGLREVDGRENNLTPGRATAGAADTLFPRLLTPQWRADVSTVTFAGPSMTVGGASTYRPSATSLIDVAPRTISNLIVDQSARNPAAVAAAGTTVPDPSSGGVGPASLVIPNTAPAGAAVPVVPPYNSMFTFFGQFFDHGLDLVGKSATSFVAIPIPTGENDPLEAARGMPMFLNRTVYPATSNVQLTAGSNRTTPWVDQNQTYASAASKQVFIREYALDGAGRPQATGRLLTSAGGAIADWATVKAQAATRLGIRLTDADIGNVPLLLTDDYGRFLRGPRGLPQLVMATNPVTVMEGSAGTPVSTSGAARTGHAFLDDIAHNAAPFTDLGAPLVADTDGTVGSTTARLASGTYDNELLDAHYVTGDGRGNENIGLIAIHTVFHAEHNRLVTDIERIINAAGTGSALYQGFRATGTVSPTATAYWSYGERLFQAARFVNEMEYQHLVFDTFARRIEPAIHAFAGYDPTVDPNVSAEFADAVYRFGHSMLNETIQRRTRAGADRSVSLFEGFLNPVAFASGYPDAGAAAASIARGSVYQVGNEIDEFVTGALRNNLVGVPLDLASLNLARGRDTGMPSLNNARMQFWQSTGNDALYPYDAWNDFGVRLRHPDSLVNFVAAYGLHPEIAGTSGDRWVAAYRLVNGRNPGTDRISTSDDTVVSDPAYNDRDAFMAGTGAWARQVGDWGVPAVGPDGLLVPSPTGIDGIDLWIGGLAETRGLGAGLLGVTFREVFKTQLEVLQDGDRFYYLSRLAGTDLIGQLANNTLADLFVRNTDAESLPADMFSAPQLVIDLGAGASALAAAGATTLNDGTVRYTGLKNAVFVGTSATDGMRSGAGNDTMRGFESNDRMDGDEGSDNLQGGGGNDAISDTGLSGIDLALGGPGDDYINTGPGIDVAEGGPGADYIRAGADGPLVNGGDGADLLLGGSGADTLGGDTGADWLDGGSGNDLLNGDPALPPLGLDLVPPGPDVLVGGLGADAYVGAGGDDIIGGGDAATLAGTPDSVIGDTGFDWMTYTTGWYGSTKPGVNADLMLIARNPGDPTQARMDVFLSGDVEALSGGIGADTLSGDSRLTLVNPFGATDALTAAGIALVDGRGVLTARLSRASIDAPGGVAIANGTDGNILFGGPGSDILNGRLGNDLIDGDASLNVWLESNCRTSSNSTGTWARTTLAAMQPYVANGTVSGACTGANFRIRREITAGTPGTDIDTAAFAGNYADYTIRRATATNGQSYVVIEGIEGIDVLWNIERLQFLDRTITLSTTATSWTPSAASSRPLLVTAVPRRGSAIVSWTLPLTPGGGTLSGYTARAFDPATLLQVGSCGVSGLTPATRTCTIGGLTDGLRYLIDVVAQNNQGTSNPSNPQVTVTSGAVVSVPGAPTNVKGLASNLQATVSWSGASSGGGTISSYTARAWTTLTGGTTPVFTCVAAGTNACTIVGPLSPFGLPPYGTYYFDVVATNEAGTGAASSPRVAVQTPPTAPTNVAATNGSTTARIAWSAPLSNGGSAVTGYTARLYDAGGALIRTSGTLASTATSFSFTGLVNGTSYLLDVYASSANGAGTPSDQLAVTPGPNPPSEPVAVTATAGNGRATVSWAAPLSAGASTISAYTARAWSTASGGASPVASCATNGTSFACDVSGLTNDLTYYIDVVAANADGAGPASSPRLAVTPRPNPPSAPTSVTVSRSDGSAIVGWSPPLDTGGSAIVGYVATAYATATSPDPVSSCAVTMGNPAPPLTCRITLLTNGTTYYVSVVASNSLGGGTPSTRQSVVPAAVPDAPTLTSASGGISTISVAWSAPAANGSPISGYTARATSGGTTLSCSTSTLGCSIGGLTNGTTYTVSVIATNGVGASAASNTMLATPQATIPSAPAGVTANGSDRSAGISWSAAASNGSTVSGYTVLAYTSAADASTDTNAQVGCTTSGLLSCAVTGLTTGTPYWFRVFATNSIGDSALSGIASATALGRPGAPTITSVTSPRTGRLAVNWSAPLSNGGSAITGYRAEALLSGALVAFCTGSSTATTCTITGLASGTTYDIRVAAANVFGYGPWAFFAGTPAAVR